MTATILQMPKPKPELRCTGCGVTQEASCDCRAAYAPVVTASEAATKAVLANMDKSNRAIAAEIGVSEGTVRNARGKQLRNDCAVEKREGIDGKIRKLPKPQAAIVAFKTKQRVGAKAAKQELADHYDAFLLRADAARQLALIGLKKTKVDDLTLRYAEKAAAAWTALVEQMKREVRAD